MLLREVGDQMFDLLGVHRGAMGILWSNGDIIVVNECTSHLTAALQGFAAAYGFDCEC